MLKKCSATTCQPFRPTSTAVNVLRTASPPAPQRGSSAAWPRSFGKLVRLGYLIGSCPNTLKSSKPQKAKPPSPAPSHSISTGRRMVASPEWCAGRSGFGEKWALPAFSSPMQARPLRIGLPSQPILCSASDAPMSGGILALGGMQQPSRYSVSAPRRNCC